ncbi:MULTISPECIES: hypothetical protein [Lysinibacillus]|uniref:Uncharacterized protein n=1 Tax=Lysinibacillus antri TaxID=2498145 RepID=A0A432L825_9BACI|nr:MULTISPECIES: hypothetical protein [Lysinibacillus]RUL48175.1 hypothetical protein EK386_17185 [Lysinibacillus antri]TSI10716.1 hypothetical protein FJQ64_03425 [Lysinibacillus sp. BW-2-10]
MRRKQIKERENKITELTIVSIFAFCIVIALLSLISIQPNVTNISFYILLFFVITGIYKPLRMSVLKMLISFFRLIFMMIKSIFYKNRISG